MPVEKSRSSIKPFENDLKYKLFGLYKLYELYELYELLRLYRLYLKNELFVTKPPRRESRKMASESSGKNSRSILLEKSWGCFVWSKKEAIARLAAVWGVFGCVYKRGKWVVGRKLTLMRKKQASKNGYLLSKMSETRTSFSISQCNGMPRRQPAYKNRADCKPTSIGIETEIPTLSKYCRMWYSSGHQPKFYCLTCRKKTPSEGSLWSFSGWRQMCIEKKGTTFLQRQSSGTERNHILLAMRMHMSMGTTVVEGCRSC